MCVVTMSLARSDARTAAARGQMAGRNSIQWFRFGINVGIEIAPAPLLVILRPALRCLRWLPPSIDSRTEVGYEHEFQDEEAAR